jgi:hypothetical protein
VIAMFVVTESIEGDVWSDPAGIFATEEAARRFLESLKERWGHYRVFSVDFPDSYPFYLTSEGVTPPSVRPIREDELERLLAQVPPAAGENDWTILFNVYTVREDSFNKAFPGESVLPKLSHKHVMPGDPG